MSKGEVSRSQELKTVKSEVLRKVSFLEHKAIIDYKEVYSLIRYFFKKYLDRDYEFTIRELREELQKTYIPANLREDTNKLLDTIERMEYATIHYTKDELVTILQVFRRVVESLVKTLTQQQSFMAKVKAFLFREEEEPIIISELPTIEDSNPEFVHTNILLERLYLFIQQKKEKKARKQYQELLSYYEQIHEHYKQEFYPLIDQAYHDLHTMILEQKK